LGGRNCYWNLENIIPFFNMQKPYYEKSKFKLYQANCLNLLAELPENSVDMVFADPPYNLSNGGITVHAGRMVSVNKGDWDKSNGLNYEVII
jgi:site-specific DNA-methyltransferase (adenine-specific)